MEKEIRNLRADEIDCRVQSVVKTGCILLLYKDARCDMRILDETYGPENWQRRHYECKGNLFCSVGIKLGDEWVWKDDCGSESNTEKEKGESSDSFKRACFNWGIGRELYTSPFIWINLEESELDNGKLQKKVKFYVSSITIEDKKITALSIVDQTGKVRYSLNGQPKTEPKVDKPKTVAPKADSPKEDLESNPNAKASFTQIKVIGDLCVDKFGKDQAAAMFTATTGLIKLSDIKISEYETIREKILKAKKTA
jgi:Uncharacterized protein conserved in bacteria